MTHQGAQRIENVGSVKLLPLLVSSLPSAVPQAFCRPGPAPQSEDKAPSPATEVQSVEQRWGEVLLVFLSGAWPSFEPKPRGTSRLTAGESRMEGVQGILPEKCCFLT